VRRQRATVLRHGRGAGRFVERNLQQRPQLPFRDVELRLLDLAERPRARRCPGHLGRAHPPLGRWKLDVADRLAGHGVDLPGRSRRAGPLYRWRIDGPRHDPRAVLVRRSVEVNRRTPRGQCR
jgi:hypothetical protein